MGWWRTKRPVQYCALQCADTDIRKGERISSNDEIPGALDVLGVRVHPLDINGWTDRVAEAVRDKRRLIVVSQNLHGVYTYHRNHAMRLLHAEAMVRIDGMIIALWAKLLRLPVRRSHRLTWVDWFPRLLEVAADRSWRIFYLGGPVGIEHAGMTANGTMQPDATLRIRNGYFERELGDGASEQVVREINAWQPDVLLVGMGMPRQESWVLSHQRSLKCPVILTCGAALEYFAGFSPKPPRWMGPLGLEGLYRFLQDPRRLWRRYLLEPWALLPLFAKDIRRRLAR